MAHIYFENIDFLFVSLIFPCINAQLFLFNYHLLMDSINVQVEYGHKPPALKSGFKLQILKSEVF